jgi:DNA-binding transcriptional MerR regulator
MFRIGEFSKLCQVPTSVLRYYDEIGLFKPEQVDTFTGYRYYSVNQLPRLNRILALRDLDLSLAEISEIIHEQISVDELKGMLRLKQAQLAQQQAEVQAKLQRVHYRLTHIEREYRMPDYEVIIKSVEATKIASIRETIPTVEQMPSRCAAMFEAVIQWLRSRQTHPAGPSLAIYHNTEYTETNIDVENGFVVDASLQDGTFTYGDFTITVHTLPRIEQIASTIHRGSFDNLIEAWQALARWIEQNGYEVTGSSSREFYLNGPNEEPVAEIQYAVKRRS